MPTITAKLSNGSTHSIDVDALDITVKQLKEQFSSVVGIPAGEQRIVFRGKILKDDQVASACGMENGHAVHVVRSAPAPASTTTPAPAPVPAPVAQDPTPAPAPAAPQAPPAQNAFDDLFAGGLGGAQPGAAAPGAAPPMMPGLFPGMGGMGGDQQAMMNNVMQNPAMMQAAMQMMQQNPAMMNMVMQSHPMFQSMSNEQREQMMRMMQDPAFLQMAMSMGGAGGMGAGGMGAFGGMGQQQGQQQPPQQANNAAQQQLQMAQLMAALGGGGGGGGMGAAPVANPQERYKDQLEQLKNMGFPNEQANLQALQMTNGNVEFAVARLLGE